jgi:phenylalanyl-tRNA synthetase beta chain
MIVSLDWLKEYVDLPMSAAELADRLALSGLNHESFSGEAIDLEVTSNRPDCLGHIGVARDISVLWESRLRRPEAKTLATADLRQAKGGTVSQITSVEITAPNLCPRYTARVVRGVKIGPSPKWLADRLRTVGIAVINNVVDVTNYVMFECGQPLHAFDFAKLAGRRIIVREAKPGERFTAINHQEYELAAGTCVIADAEKAVALAGVMGGADSEVSDSTVDVLIESADFDPLSVRTTARRHNLHSPSSYRFERGVDPDGIDWASRRACELILQTAGGELAEGVVDVGQPPQPRPVIKLRFEQIPRVLGIKVPDEAVQRILKALGCEETHVCGHCVKVAPPSWRADLTREIDLIEEVARIYGYDKIPEDSNVKMAASTRTRSDRVLAQVREVLVAAGIDEAMTLSAVDEAWVDAIQPWTEAPPLRASTPVLRRADCLRQTLVPSLLAARRHNEKLFNDDIELFEIANVYLPLDGALPQQKRLLAISSGRCFRELKGVVEALVERLAPSQRLGVGEVNYPLLDEARQCRLRLGEYTLGYLGELSDVGRERFDLRGHSTVAELDLDMLVALAELVPAARSLSPYPPVSRDLNIVVPESIRWGAVEELVRTAGGELLEAVEYQETYRDPKRLGADRKSLLISLQLRSATGTLTSEQADSVRDRIVVLLAEQLGAELRA